MTDANKIMHPQHFGIDPTDIRINPDLNPGSLLFHILALAIWRRFALSECSCFLFVFGRLSNCNDACSHVTKYATMQQHGKVDTVRNPRKDGQAELSWMAG